MPALRDPAGLGSAHTGLAAHTTKLFLFYTNRFMQLVPQYYFSNLPPSESKDILQQAAGHLPAVSTAAREQALGEGCPETAELRCALQ